MGQLLSCCDNNSKPVALEENASLKSGVKLNLVHPNDKEDSRAPLLSKIEDTKMDKDMDQFVADLDDDDIVDLPDSDDIKEAIKAD